MLTKKSFFYSVIGCVCLSAYGMDPTEIDHAILFRERDLNENMVLSGTNDDASVRFVATNLFHAEVEIRNMNISIVHELLLCSCSLTLTNCCINASNAGEDMINVCKGSCLKLVDCKVNNCIISVGAELTERAAAIWNLNPTEMFHYNICNFSNCNFSYTLPSMDLPFLGVLYSMIKLNTRKLPSLKATASPMIEANNCSFEWIETNKKSSTFFTNRQIRKISSYPRGEKDLLLLKMSRGRQPH